MGEILGSKVPSRYIQHRVNSRRGIAGLSCIYKVILGLCDSARMHTAFVSMKKLKNITLKRAEIQELLQKDFGNQGIGTRIL